MVDENGDGLADLILTAGFTARGRLDLFRGALGSAGETWHLQGWHRDTIGSGTQTSNFTEAVQVDF